MSKPILPKVGPSKWAENFLDQQRIKAQNHLDSIALPEYKVTKAEKLQHKFRHVPTYIGSGCLALGAGLLKAGQITWGVVALTVGGLLTPARKVLETQTKYGETGTFVKKDWLQMFIDFLKAVLKFIQGFK